MEEADGRRKRDKEGLGSTGERIDVMGKERKGKW